MILIYNAKIYTMNDKIYNSGCILVKNGKILEVEAKLQDLRSDLKDVIRKIDAKGNFVLPGFIEPHCHIGLWGDSMGFEGADGNEETDPMTPHLRAIDGINIFDKNFREAREAGVTSVVTGPGSSNVSGGQFVALKTYGSTIEDMIIKEPVATKIAFGENPKTVYNDKRQTPVTRMATAALLREYLKKAQDYKQMIDAYNENKEEADKPEYDPKSEALIKVLNKEIHFKAHAHRADDILTAIRIAKEFDVKLTIEHCTDGVLVKDILKREQIPAIVGPILTDRSKPELINQSPKTGGILAKNGILVAITTDHPVVPINYLPLQAAIIAKEGMDEDKALKAITINAAKVCGIDDKVGSLEVGKDADIIILDGHPFVLKTNVVLTMINGEVVYEKD